MKRLNDSSDVPEARLGIVLKTDTSSKRTTKTHCTRPWENWVFPAASTKEPEEREFVVILERVCTWSASETLTLLSLETVRTSRSPTTVMTANGEVQTK